MKRWIRNLFPAKTERNQTNRTTTRRSPAPPIRRKNRLQLEELEPWIVPDSRTFGGLMFSAPGALASTPVTVSVENESTPLLRFSGGVQFDNSTFTPAGTVSGITQAGDVGILNGTMHAPINPSALLGSGVTIAGAESQGVFVPVTGTGTQLAVESLAIAGDAANRFLSLDGRVSLSGISNLAGLLEFALPSTVDVVLGSGGAKYDANFQVTLPGNGDDKISFRKLEIEFGETTIGYNLAANTFTFSGGVKVSNDIDETKNQNKAMGDNKAIFKEASATLGDEDGPGIVITNGQVASVNVVLNADFNLYGVNVAADDLKIQFDTASGLLEISGGVQVMLTDQLGFGATLNQPLAIDTTSGEVTLPNGLDISGSLMVGGFGAEINIVYVPTATGFRIGGGITLDLTNFEIGGSFSIVNGNLSSIALGFAASGASPGIALGNTGLFISKFSGSVMNLDRPEDIEVMGSMTVVFGKKITVAGSEFAIFDATGTFTIDPDSVKIDASVNLVGGILGKGTGSIDINWTTGDYRLRVDAEFLFIFRFNGDLAFDNTGNVTLNATAAIQVPSAVPVIGGTQLFSANVYLQIRPQLQDESQNFVAAWSTTDLGFLGSFTVGFQSTFSGQVSFLSEPPMMTAAVGAASGDPVFTKVATNSVDLISEPGIESYLVTVNYPRFAETGYDGTREYFQIFDADFPPVSKFVAANPQNTVNISSGNNVGSFFYDYEIFPNTGVPHEPGLTSQSGMKSSQRVFVVPSSFFTLGSAPNTLAAGKLGMALFSKDSLDGKQQPTFSITPRYRPSTAMATMASVNPTTTATTVSVSGLAFGPNVNKTVVDIYRNDPSRRTDGILVGSVTLNPNSPNQFYNKATGEYTASVEFNGLIDAITEQNVFQGFTFFARVNDGSNSLNEPDFLERRRSNVVTLPNPLPGLTLNNPSGSTPSLSNPTKFVQPTADPNAPGGSVVIFGGTGPNVSFSSQLPLQTSLTLSVNGGGFIGTGSTIAVANAKQTTITTGLFASAAEATAFLGTLRFVANERFSGESIITITATNITPAGSRFSRTLTVPIIRNPFFLDEQQGFRVPLSGFFGEVGTKSNDRQINFATGFEGQGPYRFRVVNGDLHGLTLSDTGLVSGTPTTPTAGGLEPELVTIAAYDKTGTAAILTYNVQIGEDPAVLFPGPIDDTATTSQLDSGINILVIDNDYIPAGLGFPRNNLLPVINLPGLLQPQHGTIQTSGDPTTKQTTIFYQPAQDFVGTDTFEYRVAQDGAERKGKVTVTVTPYIVNNLGNDPNDPVGLTLTRAIGIANQTLGKQTITFSPELFTSARTIRLDKSALLISDDVTIIGPGSNLLTIDGNGTIGEGVFINEKNNVAISGLTITNGRRDDGPGVLNGGTLVLDDLIIAGNETVDFAGGQAADGGGVFNSGTLTIRNSVIRDNAARDGGGIFNTGTLTVANTTIANNVARTGEGGGIMNNGSTASAVVTNGTISGNAARGTGGFGNGGGIMNFQAQLTLENVTISDNYANENGGGIANLGGTLLLTNGTIVLNGADADNSSPSEFGGGIATIDDDDQMGTITPATTKLFNTILAGNTVNASRAQRQNIADDDLNGDRALDASSSFNLIADPNTAGGLTNGNNGNLVGLNGNVRPIETILDRLLLDNGGPTRTHALRSNSVAINAGGNQFLSPGVDFDQRSEGFSRIIQGTVDLGSTEVDTITFRVVRFESNQGLGTIVPNQPITFTIEFNRPVNASTVSAADFANLGTAQLQIGAIATISPTTMTVGVTPTTPGTLLLQLAPTAMVQDAGGQPLLVPARAADLFTSMNSMPVAKNDLATTPFATAKTIAVLANDSDVNGDSLAVVGFVAPANGQIAINPDQTITYTPAAGFSGMDMFTYSIDDGRGGTATASVTVTVEAPSSNSSPTISNIANQSTTTGVAAGPIGFTVGDVETPAGALSVTAKSSNLELVPINNVTFGGSGGNRSVTVAPATGQTGTATITVTVTDGNGTTVSDTFDIVVNPPSSLLVGFPQFTIGADVGGARVTRFNADGTLGLNFAPFGDGFTGGVRTAAADFNGDGVADIVSGTGPGVPTLVLVQDGKTAGLLFQVAPFETSFTGGVYVAAGDVNGDGVPDLAITPDEGGGPRVDMYSGNGFAKFVSFFGIDDVNFRGGARASIADMTGDRVGDLIVVAGFGGGPRVAAFDGTTLSKTPQKIFGDFFAFEQTLRNGIFVTAGDINGDGFADLIAGGGPGGGPRVLVFDGKSLLSNQYVNLANFFGGDPNSRGGIRMAVKDLDGDNRADLVVGAGAGAGSRVTAYLGKNITPAGTPPNELDFDVFAGFTGGVFVG